MGSWFEGVLFVVLLIGVLRLASEMQEPRR